MSDQTPQTPRSRAHIDLLAAAVSLEETEQTLKAGGHPAWAAEAAALRTRLMELAHEVDDA